MRSLAFRQELVGWLDHVDLFLRCQPDLSERLASAYDRFLDVMEALENALDDPTSDVETLLQRQAMARRISQWLFDQIWREHGPTRLSWVNQTLQRAEAFLEGGERPTDLLPLLSQHASELLRIYPREQVWDLTDSLTTLGELLSDPPSGSAADLRACLVTLRQEIVRWEPDLLRLAERNLGQALETLSWQKDPRRREEIIQAVVAGLQEQRAALEAEMAEDDAPAQRLTDMVACLEKLEESFGNEAETEAWALFEQLQALLDAGKKPEVGAVACLICGQELGESSRCSVCGSLAKLAPAPVQRDRSEHWQALEEAVADYESGQVPLESLQAVVDQGQERTERILQELSLDARDVRAAAERLRAGYEALSQVSSPSDPRLAGGRQQIASAFEQLEHLTSANSEG